MRPQLTQALQQGLQAKESRPGKSLPPRQRTHFVHQPQRAHVTHNRASWRHALSYGGEVDLRTKLQVTKVRRRDTPPKVQLPTAGDVTDAR